MHVMSYQEAQLISGYNRETHASPSQGVTEAKE